MLLGMMLIISSTAQADQHYNLFFHPNSQQTSSSRRDLNSFTIIPIHQGYDLNKLGEPIAQVHYEATTNKTGWATLSLSTSANFEDEDQAFAAGFVEGRFRVCCHYENRK